jgi:hypothetical protein
MFEPESWYRRKAAAEALRELGFPVSPNTLSTMATRGGGPPYRLFGKFPIYRGDDLRAWALARSSAPASSTSEHRARLASPSAAVASAGA